MALDFRATQVQTNRIIIGSDGRLLVYPLAADGTPHNQGNIDASQFVISSIGTDVLVYVSGAVGSNDVAGSRGNTTFGGDIVVSGNLKVIGDYGDTSRVFTETSDVTLLWSSDVLPINSVRNFEFVVLAKEEDNANIARFKRECVVGRTTGSVTMITDVYAVVPDYKSMSTWGVTVTPSGSHLNVYVTGSSGHNVFWRCKSSFLETTEVR